MANTRKIIFANGEIYHIFNRGLDKRPTFTNKRELDRAKNLIKFYRHSEIPIRFSKLLQQPVDTRNSILEKLYKSEKLVDILSYCLMPNHFHFLLKQLVDGGITEFVSKISNSYTKYYNTKYDRVGPLLQGEFKSVLVEKDEQFTHLSRYIHLNPKVSLLVKDLETYEWSSYREYLGQTSGFCAKQEILNLFKNPDAYKQFVLDQADHGEKLEQIKHQILEEVEV